MNEHVAEPQADTSTTADTRTRIIAAAAALLAEGGRDAVTTRAVAAAASVQAPAIYRLFGDKDGLLDAVAQHLLHTFVDSKSARALDPDPVSALRDGWDLQLAFSLAHPDVFAIMMADPTRPRQSPAALAGIRVLEDKIRQVARAGRLKVSESSALHLIRAAANGAIMTLLGQPEATRDPGLAGAMRDAVFAAVIADAPATGRPAAPTAAIALRANLPAEPALTASEKALLGEWLDRIIQATPTPR